MSAGTRQLLTYTFPPGSEFQGGLVGALERVESGGAMRILDALFVARQPESGELVAISMSSDSSAGMIGRLLSLRLEESARRAATERALTGRSGDLIRSLADGLEPGAAVAAVLVEHAWALTLEDTIRRMGGTGNVSQFVEAGELTELPELTQPSAEPTQPEL